MYRALVCFVVICFLDMLCLHHHHTQYRDSIPQQIKVAEPVAASVIDDPVQEIFATWRLTASKLKSYSFEIQTEEVDHVYEKKTNGCLKIQMLVKQDGSCSMRLDSLDNSGKLKESMLIVGTQMHYLNYHEKIINSLSLSKKMMKSELADFTGWFFPTVPFFLSDVIDLRKRFQVTLVQKDDHYTWLKFIPTRDVDRKDYVVAQVGAINYLNSMSQKHFPLYIMWREPGGKDISWKFKKILINDPVAVTEADFRIDIAQLQSNSWKSIQGNGLFSWLIHQNTLEQPDWVKEKMKEKIPKPSK
jgi:hypothetical protein